MQIIFICAILELIKRPIGWILYPFAFFARRRPRAGEILWYVLDDSIVTDNLRRGFPGWEYCGYGKRSALVEKLPAGRFKEFARSFYWGAWRNSWINFMIWTENKIGELYFTAETYIIVGEKWKFFAAVYERRKFAEIKMLLPYIEAWFGGWRFQAGFLSCGRWQIQFRNLGLDKRPYILQ